MGERQTAGISRCQAKISVDEYRNNRAFFLSRLVAAEGAEAILALFGVRRSGIKNVGRKEGPAAVVVDEERQAGIWSHLEPFGAFFSFLVE